MTATTFEYTPLMQTYLNAFVVSDFDYITNANNKRPDELLQSVYGQSRFVGSGEADFALEAGERIMQAMETYFQYNYTLPKIDQFGIPDFSAGAMENWGLVTYREPYLYYNPDTSPMSQLDLVASIVAHEYAHQFFGNTVSPQWWTYLWLNEGFAALFENNAVDLVYPGLRLGDYMQVSVCQSVMQNDASENARPMNYYAESPGSIERLFDFVAYSKCELNFCQIILVFFLPLCLDF
jgi:aminopeptidase N